MIRNSLICKLINVQASDGRIFPGLHTHLLEKYSWKFIHYFLSSPSEFPRLETDCSPANKSSSGWVSWKIMNLPLEQRKKNTDGAYSLTNEIPMRSVYHKWSKGMVNSSKDLISEIWAVPWEFIIWQLLVSHKPFLFTWRSVLAMQKIPKMCNWASGQHIAFSSHGSNFLS